MLGLVGVSVSLASALENGNKTNKPYDRPVVSVISDEVSTRSKIKKLKSSHTNLSQEGPKTLAQSVSTDILVAWINSGSKLSLEQWFYSKNKEKKSYKSKKKRKNKK